MAERQHTILIVEDDRQVARALKRTISLYIKRINLPAHIQLAHTVQDGRRLFDEYRNEILVILLDENVPGSIPETSTGEENSTVPLARYIRSCFWAGPIVSISNSPRGQQRLHAAGCEKDLQVNKEKAAAKVIEMLSRFGSAGSTKPPSKKRRRKS